MSHWLKWCSKTASISVDIYPSVTKAINKSMDVYFNDVNDVLDAIDQLDGEFSWTCEVLYFSRK